MTGYPEGMDEEQQAPEGAGSEPVPSSMIADRAVQATDEILRLMGLQATSALQANAPDGIYLDIEGPDVGHIIGHHGATLNALQLVVAIGLRSHD